MEPAIQPHPNRQPREIVIKHFLDSLTCLTAVEFPPDAEVIDVGSGAGFPGVPMEIARPDLNITLLDSTRKRLAFLEALLEELGLAGAAFWKVARRKPGRDPGRRAYYDFAVARAVARLNVLAEYLLPIIRVGGYAIAQKGPDRTKSLRKRGAPSSCSVAVSKRSPI